MSNPRRPTRAAGRHRRMPAKSVHEATHKALQPDKEKRALEQPVPLGEVNLALLPPPAPPPIRPPETMLEVAQKALAQNRRRTA